MKTIFRRLLLGFWLVGIAWVLVFYVTPVGIPDLVPFVPTTHNFNIGLPVRLTIPAIGVDAAIVPVGVTRMGEMEVPSKAGEVGWFKYGSRPGATGSAVLAGHFDGKQAEVGVFFNLFQLQVGDKLYVADDMGEEKGFVVTGSREYLPGYAEEVFISTGSAQLNLVTCDGVWDGVTKSYSKRLVVLAEAN